MPRYSTRNLKHRNRPGGECIFCRKKIFATQEEARQKLGYLARTSQGLSEAKREGDLFAMQAYRCGAGFWHLGRNGETVRKVEKFLKRLKEQGRTEEAGCAGED